MQKHVNLVDLELSMSLFLNLLFETDSYSNEYLDAKIGIYTAENEPLLFREKIVSMLREPSLVGCCCAQV